MIRKSFRYFYFVDFRIFWICKILYFTLIINADSNYFSWCYFMGSNRSRKGSLWQLLRKIFSSFQLLRKSFPEHVLTYFFCLFLMFELFGQNEMFGPVRCSDGSVCSGCSSNWNFRYSLFGGPCLTPLSESNSTMELTVNSLQRDVEMKYGYTSDDVEFSICGGFRGSIEMWL